MRERVTDKRRMYELLSADRIGNTIPQYSSVKAWLASGEDQVFPFWGVRTRTPGGPCRLNCPAAEVPATVESFRPHAPNISVMISSVGRVTWLGEVWDSPSGLICSGVEYPPEIHDWRPLMRHPTLYEGVAARGLLRRHLNPNSHDDLMELLEIYPDHVIEFSAMDRCYGTLPHRNAITWEVRAY
jgi:hypothetical protein